MRTLEQFEQELDLLLDEIQEETDLITDESVQNIKQRIKEFCQQGINEGIFEKMPYIDVEVKEDIGAIDITIGDEYEKSKNNTSNSKKRKQATSTRGESLTRVVR